MKKLVSKTSQASTARYPMSLYLKMLNKAEELKICMAELQRIAMTSYLKADESSIELKKLEMRLAHRFFYISCAVNGLNEEEIKEAKHELKTKYKGEG
jgi:hypothetical protein